VFLSWLFHSGCFNFVVVVLGCLVLVAGRNVSHACGVTYVVLLFVFVTSSCLVVRSRCLFLSRQVLFDGHCLSWLGVLLLVVVARIVLVPVVFV